MEDQGESKFPEKSKFLQPNAVLDLFENIQLVNTNRPV